jgi:hypothetical protein
MASVALGFALVGLPIGIGTLDEYGPTGLVFIIVSPAIVRSLTCAGAFVAFRVPGNPMGGCSRRRELPQPSGSSGAPT